MSRRRPGRGHATSETGSALVELAVALPVLVLILVGAADFARVFYRSIELTNAARAGAQYGAQSTIKSVDTAGIKTAAVNAAPDIPSFTTSNITVSPTVCQCFNDAGSVLSTPACATGCTTGHLVVTVTVTATKTFSTISHLPPFQNALTLTRMATMRAQ